MTHLMLAALLAAAACLPAAGRVYQGSFSTRAGSLPPFLGKFAFGKGAPNEVVGSMSVTYNTSAVTLALLEFDDDAWEQVISREVACQDLNMLATGRLTLLPSATSRVVQFMESERPHYWYFQFVSLPDCSVPVSATYTVTFLQADGSQLSYDAKGMPATAAVFFTMYLIFMAVLGFVYFFRSRPPFVPRLVKLLLLAVLLYTFAIMFSLIHFSKEDVDGEATSGSLVMYSLCSLSAYLTLWALAVYAAGGLGITKPNWSWKENIPFISMYTTLLVTCLALVIVLFADYEPMEPNFVVNMWPRIVLVVASILFGLFWCIRMRRTYMTEARVDKRKALRTLFIVLGVQFLIQPVFEIIAAASPEYERLRVAAGFEFFIMLCVFISIAYALWPSRVADAFKNFEYGADGSGSFLAMDDDDFESSIPESHAYVAMESTTPAEFGLSAPSASHTM